MAAVAFSGNGSASIASGGSFTSLDVTESFDSDGWHDNATDPRLMTVPVDGWYLLLGSCQWDEPISGSCQVRFLVDGTTAYGTNGCNRSSLAGLQGCTSTRVLYLTAGQTVELQQYHSANTSSVLWAVAITRLPTPMFSGRSSGGTGGAPIDLTEDVDEANWHSDGTNPSRVTVDTTGTYLVMGSSLSSGGSSYDQYTSVYKNGSQAFFCYESVHNSGSEDSFIPIVAVVSLTAGDYLELVKSQASTDSQFSVSRINDVRCAHATLASDVAVTDGVMQNVTLDSETVDTDGFHSTSSNTDRMTIPAGAASVYMYVASITTIADVGALQYIAINGGAGVASTGMCNTGGPGLDNKPGGSVLAWVADCADGDYFSEKQDTFGDTIEAVGTYACIVCLDDLVYGSSFVPQIYRRVIG